MKLTSLITAAFFAANIAVKAQNTCVQYVNPFIGTGAVDKNSLSGSNFPGATTPFGLVQLSPDTQESPDNPASGYDHNDKTIVGFSHTHLSGTGVSDLYDVLMMPTTGQIKTEAGDADKPGSGYRSAYSHSNETARAGYYQVMLTDYHINAELTATERVGMHRYTFPQSNSAHIIIDMDHTLPKQRTYYTCRIQDAQLRVINNKTIEGYRLITGWAYSRRVYFRAEFSKPFASNVMVEGKHRYNNLSVINGTSIKAALNFNTTQGEQILVKVGLSATGIAGARLNMQTELPGWDFNKVAQQAQNKWEKQLETIKIEGTTEQKQIFYTGMYHAFTQPNNLADVNGDYMATDLTIRNAPDKTHYSTLSLWDTYRAANPLYTLIAPKFTARLINSMMRQYDTYGYLPIWQLWGEETYCMIGNHAIPILVDAVLKGIPGIDPQKAYQAVKGSATTPHQASPFYEWEKYGYIPEDVQSQSVSITLEMAYDDWCVAQLAKKLGKTADYDRFINRGEFYCNLYNPETGFFQAKKTDGKWLEPFNPLQYGGNGGNPYTEGNAWQYFWYVPQNVQGLIGLTGGAAAFNAKLDQFFTLNDLPGEVNGNASGFIGQYAHGNEPSHHITYLYDYSGQPWKTQMYANRVMSELYNNSFSGYAGNEDCGQMSSWYIFSAMGFYPVNPASGVYALGSPILAKAEVNLGNGKVFTSVVKNPGKANIYIQSVKLNGKAYTKTYITQKDIATGSTIEFTMGPKPNFNWGNDPRDAPLDFGY